MRRRLAGTLSVVAVVVCAMAVALAQAEVVYVTRIGSKYHRASCRSLAKSKIEMPLKEAAARYGPCSICRPPIAGSKEARNKLLKVLEQPSEPSRGHPPPFRF